MAKKDKKKKDNQGSGAVDAVEAVRSAIERTFQATQEGAAGTQRRTRDLVEDIAHAAARVRETLDDLRVLEDVRALRREIADLSQRVASLEEKAAAPARASRSTAKTASRSGGSTRKTATSKSSSAARPPAAKTRSTASRAKSS